MAMAEQPRPGWTSYHNPHNNNCQDLGNSILLLLGLIICINIGINMVTLLWHRLRGFLNQVFHIVCEKEAKPCPPEKQIEPRKQSSPTVHLRCTMDPVKMTVTPPSVRRHRRRGSSGRRPHRHVACGPDTEDEKPPHHCPAFCSNNCNAPPNWGGFQSTQGWAPWGQDAPEPPSQTIRFQQPVRERPPRVMQSELSLEAYVYPVNPPPPSPQARNLKNNGPGAGAGVEQEKTCLPDPPPMQGPALIPEIPQHGSSTRIVYDARDVRRRLRELTREVEALSHCYPVLFEPNALSPETEKDWIHRHLPDR